MEVTMSSVYRSQGPSYLFDNDNTTIAHTRDNTPEIDWINIHLHTPQFVGEVLVMGRQETLALNKLNNTVINTTDLSSINKECGKVILEEYISSIIVRVTCKEARRVVNVRVMAPNAAFSINIAELRICRCGLPCTSKYLKLVL